MRTTAEGPLRVALVGGESTGKTTLARTLADAFGAVLVPEYARTYAEGRSAPLTADDVEPIARGQMAAEDLGRRRARRLLILDTDLVSTVVYARHYYGACPPWIEERARERRADLYLLHHPDVPWVADGEVRDAPTGRDAVHRLFQATLDDIGAYRVDVKGSWPERARLARLSVEALLEERV